MNGLVVQILSLHVYLQILYNEYLIIDKTTIVNLQKNFLTYWQMHKLAGPINIPSMVIKNIIQ